MLCQPIVLLYNNMVMQEAAAEGCRLLMTQTVTGSGSYAEDKYRGYIERRLGPIPPLSIFHLHEGACSYVIGMKGNELSDVVSVSITNKVRLLPLLGIGAELSGSVTRGESIFKRSKSRCRRVPCGFREGRKIGRADGSRE